MPFAFRDRIPALLLVGLLHLMVVYAFLHAIIVEHAPRQVQTQDRETKITLMRDAPALQLQKPKHRQRVASGSTAITLPVFNPYTYNTPLALQGATNGVAIALSACDVGRYDMASTEVRTMCNRIGALLKSDPGRFGFTTHVVDPQHWQTELARREAPVLAPCMSPSGVDVLYTLKCVYETVFIGYDSENHRRYSQ